MTCEFFFLGYEPINGEGLLGKYCGSILETRPQHALCVCEREIEQNSQTNVTFNFTAQFSQQRTWHHLEIEKINQTNKP